jgi:CrcB protein
MLLNLSFVALGGALGSCLRYLMGLALVRGLPAVTASGFPIGVLPVNVLGSFLMGAFVVYAHQRGFASANLFVMTGLLGGFTTFSAFSLEAVTLIERGSFAQAAVYIGGSVVLSLLGLMAGLFIARGLWA